MYFVHISKIMEINKNPIYHKTHYKVEIIKNIFAKYVILWDFVQRLVFS